MTGAITESLLPTLIAAVDRIIPADDYPAASENGVVAFIERLLASDLSTAADAFCAGVASLDAEARSRFGSPFHTLTHDQQDLLLTQIESGDTVAVWRGSAARWFELLVRLTHEGYYADPSNGGNATRTSWKMVGFEPGRPL